MWNTCMTAVFHYPQNHVKNDTPGTMGCDPLLSMTNHINSYTQDKLKDASHSIRDILWNVMGSLSGRWGTFWKKLKTTFSTFYIFGNMMVKKFWKIFFTCFHYWQLILILYCTGKNTIDQMYFLQFKFFFVNRRKPYQITPQISNSPTLR